MDHTMWKGIEMVPFFCVPFSFRSLGHFERCGEQWPPPHTKDFLMDGPQVLWFPFSLCSSRIVEWRTLTESEIALIKKDPSIAAIADVGKGDWHESKQNAIVLVVRTALLPFLFPHYHILLLFPHCLSPALPSSRLHFLAIISSIFRYSRPHPTCWVCDHTLFESNNSLLQYTRVSISTSGRNKRHS